MSKLPTEIYSEFITWTLARHTPKTRVLKCPNCFETNDCIAMKK